MNDETFAQSELINYDFQDQTRDVLQGLLKPGLYIFADPSKVGKSMIVTSLAYATACGNDYLGRNTIQGLVVYFDNDNYASQTKERIKTLDLPSNDYLIYNFENAQSFSAMKNYIHYGLDDRIDQLRLVVIDCYANLYELRDLDSYTDNYGLLKKMLDFAMSNAFCMILVHHTKKGNFNGQDALLGSRALSAATSSTITIETENDFSSTATLSFNLRHLKEQLSIKKDPKGINWILNEDTEPIEDHIDENVLSIIHTLAKLPTKEIRGSCQELSAKFNYTENPKGLYRFLEKHCDTLQDNNVSFSRSRNGQKRLISLTLNDYE